MVLARSWPVLPLPSSTARQTIDFIAMPPRIPRGPRCGRCGGGGWSEVAGWSGAAGWSAGGGGLGWAVGIDSRQPNRELSLQLRPRALGGNHDSDGKNPLGRRERRPGLRGAYTERVG